MATQPPANPVPNLRAWLVDRPDHPIMTFFQPPDGLVIPEGSTWLWWKDPVLTTVDEIICVLESAQVPGLGNKRRMFRDFRGQNALIWGKFVELRAELVVASMLTESGVAYEFNTGDGPDLLLATPTGRRVAVEVTSKAPEGLKALGDDITTALEAAGIDADLHLFAEDYPPVAIRRSVRTAITNQLLARVNGGEFTIVARQEVIPGRPADRIPACTLKIQFDRRPAGHGVQVVLHQLIRQDSPHAVDIGRQIAENALRTDQKARQAVNQPTLLVVDITRCTGGSAAATRGWSDIFDSLWQPNDLYVAVAIMVCSDNQRTPDLACSVNPHAPANDLADLTQALQGSALGVLLTDAQAPG